MTQPRKEAIWGLLAALLAFPAAGAAHADTIAAEPYALAQYIPPPAGAVAGGTRVLGVGGGYGGGAATILVVGLVAAMNGRSEQNNANNPGYMASKPPPMDPNRKISEQDCTKPIVFDGGNLRCK